MALPHRHIDVGHTLGLQLLQNRIDRLVGQLIALLAEGTSDELAPEAQELLALLLPDEAADGGLGLAGDNDVFPVGGGADRKSTRLNSSHVRISYAVFCLK